ncbi:MAG: 2TM domain-containing protein [Flavobacteriaceae bacterium]
MESKERIHFSRAKSRLQKVKNWYLTIPVYVIVTLLVSGMVYSMRVLQFTDFLIYMFMAFPLILWFFFFVQVFLVLGRKPRFLKNWEEREILRHMEAEDVEVTHYK